MPPKGAHPPGIAPPLPPGEGFGAPVRSLRGVGERLGALLARRGVRTVRDLLFFFPRKYEDRRTIRSPGEMVPGERGAVLARVERLERVPTRREGLLLVRATLVGDRGDRGSAVWFSRRGLERQIPPGTRALFYGRCEAGTGGGQLVHPDFDVLAPGEVPSGGILPLYPGTAGLSQRRLRHLIQGLLAPGAPLPPDPLPEDLRRRLALVSLDQALREMHFPRGNQEWRQARRRLVFEEFFLLQVAFSLRRRLRRAAAALPLAGDGAWQEDFFSRLPFRLTRAQRRAWEELREDLRRPVPMHRLLQGDVGSGKTVVAAAALAAAAAAGSQGVLLAPTEALARQHGDRLGQLLAPLGWEPLLVLGGGAEKERRRVREALASGEARVVVGTHALIAKGVTFRHLALVVVDEQHRFGVLQRAALAGKGIEPHVLVMTATPIPRTLLLGSYGDLDVSVLDEKPPGRKPVVTRWIPQDRRDEALEVLRRELDAGRQGYWICPLVEESENPSRSVAAVTRRYRALQEVLAGHAVGLLHGRLPSREKARVLEDFATGRLALLVSTSVVEVGIDVPGATVLVVEDAPSFGLAQLHQLRGRVGRGKDASVCLLVGDPSTPEGRGRLEALCASEDGFFLAEEDLRLRGPGDLGGVRQHGLAYFRVADLGRDGALLEMARQEARRLSEEDPRLEGHLPLRLRVEEEWEERFSLLGAG